MEDKPTPAELKRRNEEARQKALDSFRFTRIQVPGDQALATWASLGASGTVSPVVVGDDDALHRVVKAATEWPGISKRSSDEILEIAGRLRHPGDLTAKSAKDTASAREQFTQLLRNRPEPPIPDFLQTAMGGTAQALSRDEAIAAMLNESSPQVGEWPATAPGSPGLSVASGLNGGPLPVAHVIIIPTDDWTTIPAYLNWGNWNGCPAPEYHVAALRAWRDRFGAELVGLSHDVMNLRVARKPATRFEALDLAREHYTYCPDVVDQGVGTLSELAAALMENDWWYFWWD